MKEGASVTRRPGVQFGSYTPCFFSTYALFFSLPTPWFFCSMAYGISDTRIASHYCIRIPFHYRRIVFSFFFFTGLEVRRENWERGFGAGSFRTRIANIMGINRLGSVVLSIIINSKVLLFIFTLATSYLLF